MSLDRLKEHLLSTLPKFSDVSLLHRGLSIPMDRFLSGNARFAKKIGEYLPVIMPDNTMLLSSDTAGSSSILYVENLVPAVAPGCVIKLGTELFEVDDVDSVNSTITLLYNATEFAYSKGTEVLLYAVPLAIVQPSGTPGALGPFRISGTYRVYNGDVLSYITSQSEGAFPNIVEVEIERVSVINTSTNECSFYIKHPVSASMLASLKLAGATMYVRAYPAYSSGTITLEDPSTDSIGPFLADFMHGNLTDSKEQVRNVRTLYGYSIHDESTPILTVYEAPDNQQVMGHIHNSCMLLWTLVHGSLNRRPGWTSATLDSEGRFAIVTDLVPSFEPSHTWLLSIVPQGTTDVRFTYGWDYGEPIVTTLISGTLNTVSLQLVTEPATRLEITLYGSPGQEVLFGEFAIQERYAQLIKYDVVSHVSGNFNHFHSGLIVKPYFQTLKSLHAQLGGGYGSPVQLKLNAAQTLNLR